MPGTSVKDAEDIAIVEAACIRKCLISKRRRARGNGLVKILHKTSFHSHARNSCRLEGQRDWQRQATLVWLRFERGEPLNVIRKVDGITVVNAL